MSETVGADGSVNGGVRDMTWRPSHRRSFGSEQFRTLPVMLDCFAWGPFPGERRGRGIRTGLPGEAPSLARGHWRSAGGSLNGTASTGSTTSNWRPRPASMDRPRPPPWVS